MAISPNKSATRLAHLTDPSSIPLPASPEKTRTLRRPPSHQHLSTNQPSLLAQQRPQQQQQPRAPLASRASREQLNQNPQNPSIGNSIRTRANSDAPTPFERPKPIRKLPVPAAHTRKSSLEVALRDGPLGGNVEQGLASLRYSVITSRVEAGKEGMSDYRIYLWLVLLNIPALPTDDYLKLVHRGHSPAYPKIKNDTFRTLATDTLFKRRVTDASITRVLNAVAWKLYDVQQRLSRPTTPAQSSTATNPDSDSEARGLYVQGMNVLAAPFLYASRSEVEAYALFHTFITRECPGYIRGAMEGVHKGVALVDKCLAIINPSLANFLQAKNLPAKIYALSSVLTFCACTPPLPEVLHLWDFLFAYGPHLNILCIVAQLLLLKDRLLVDPRQVFFPNSDEPYNELG